MDRRAFLSFVSFAATGTCALAEAKFPERPVTVIMPYGAGTSTDVWCRLIAANMAPALGQPLVIENKPGAGGIVGAKMVASAKADGYTLLVAGSAQICTAQVLSRDPPYDSRTDFTPIGVAGTTQVVLAVGPAVKAATIEDFVATGRTSGGITIGYVSPFSQLAAALFKSRTGLNVTAVPYKGSNELAVDLIGGRIDCVADAVVTALSNIQSGKVRPLAIFSLQRAPQLPSVPTFEEIGMHGMEFEGWFGFVGPAGLPASVVSTLNSALRKALASGPATGPGSYAAASMIAAPSTPEQMRALIAADIDRYTVLATSTGIEKQ